MSRQVNPYGRRTGNAIATIRSPIDTVRASFALRRLPLKDDCELERKKVELLIPDNVNNRWTACYDLGVIRKTEDLAADAKVMKSLYGFLASFRKKDRAWVAEYFFERPLVNAEYGRQYLENVGLIFDFCRAVPGSINDRVARYVFNAIGRLGRKGGSEFAEQLKIAIGTLKRIGGTVEKEAAGCPRSVKKAIAKAWAIIILDSIWNCGAAPKIGNHIADATRKALSGEMLLEQGNLEENAFCLTGTCEATKHLFFRAAFSGALVKAPLVFYKKERGLVEKAAYVKGLCGAETGNMVAFEPESNSVYEVNFEEGGIARARYSYEFKNRDLKLFFKTMEKRRAKLARRADGLPATENADVPAFEPSCAD